MLSKLADLTLMCWFIFFDDFAVCLEYLEIVHHLNILEQGSAPGQQGFDPTVRSEQHPIAVSTRRHSEHRWASARAPLTPLLGGWAEGGRCGACLIDDDEDDGDDHADEDDDDDDDDDDDEMMMMMRMTMRMTRMMMMMMMMMMMTMTMMTMMLTMTLLQSWLGGSFCLRGWAFRDAFAEF